MKKKPAELSLRMLLSLSLVLLIGVAIFLTMNRPAPGEEPPSQSQNSQQDDREKESPADPVPVSDSGANGDVADASDETPVRLLPSQVVGRVFPKVDLDALAFRLPREEFAVFERARREFPKVDWTEIEPTHQAFLDKRSEFPLNLNDEQREAYAAWLAEVEPVSRSLIRLRAEAHGLSAGGMEGGQGFYIDGFRDGVPVYVVTANVGAATTTGASYVRWNPGNPPFDPALGSTINGGELYVNVNDHGEIYEHTEFQLPNAGGSRIMVKQVPGYENGDREHMTHVAGTMAAWGYSSNLQGMAPRSWIRSLIQQSTNHITTYGMATPGQQMGVTNPRTGNLQLRSVAGNTSLGTANPYNRYDTASASYDTVMRDHPYYMHFNSTGNSGSQGYESLTGGWKIAKNMIGIGNVTAATRNSDGVYTGGGNISGSSSRGPTYDGRINPDFVAKGSSVLSTTGTSSSGLKSGTSMASPNAAGSVALLMDYVRQRLPQQYLRSSTYRALLANTADDRGNPGPDYIYGWGIINIHAAAKIVREQAENPALRLIVEDTLAPSQTWTETYSSDGSEPIRVTIAWLDPASTNTNANSRASRLVNDLDLRLIGPGGVEHMVYVMPFTTGQGAAPAFDPSLYNAHAVLGDNTTDPVEQVYLAAPSAGLYTVRVTHKGNLLGNLGQPFSVAVSGLSDQIDPDDLVLYSITPSSEVRGSVVSVDITGANLSPDTEVKLEKPGEPDIFLTSREMIGDDLRGNLDLTVAASGSWSVTATNPDSQTATLFQAFTVDPVFQTILSEDFDASTSLPTGWSSTATDPGLGWSIVSNSSHTPTRSAFAPNPDFVASQYLESPGIQIPADGTGMSFSFWHHYELETNFDGGRLEFSLDGGAWFGIEDSGSGASFSSNGYTSTISTSYDSPIGGKSAWSGNSAGYVRTVVEITDEAKYAGKSLRARWHLASDSSVSWRGWNVDTVEFTAEGDPVTGGFIAVTPLEDFTPSGSIGGSFSPASREYTLRNTGGSTIAWTASKAGDWIELSAPGGTLEPGAETTVTVSLNTAANALGIGSYAGSVSFANTTDGNGDTTREVSLTVNPIPVEVTLGGLATTYDGSPKPVSVTTDPPGLAYSISYGSSSTPPTDAGTYLVVVNITEPNHSGGTVGDLVIARAQQTITFAPIGSVGPNDDPFPLNATSSSGLPVSFTSSNPSVASVSGGVVTPVAVGTTIITASQAGDGNFDPAPDFPQTLSLNAQGQIATGGVVTYVDGHFIHTFTQGGSFEVIGGGAVNVEVLVVGGGGGGGNSRNYGTAGAGGGGAGGIVHEEAFQASGSIGVLVGAGGVGSGTNFVSGGNGGDSVFGSLVALGGGGGSSANQQGLAGGSGGGSRGNANGGAGLQPASASGGSGHPGGGWTSGGGDGAGGGGGAGEAAPSAPPHDPKVGGPGGSGLAYDIGGSLVHYAGGGGGGGSTTSAFGPGGLGGGGNGANDDTPPTPGAPHTGGGGGGGNNNRTGAAGGSGIVIVRYPAIQLTPYQTWAAAKGLEGADALPDTVLQPDGLSNLQRFAFGIEPGVSTPRPVGFVAGGAITAPGKPTLMNFAAPGLPDDERAVFARRKDHAAAGLLYTVEFSPDMVSWTDSSATPTVLTDPENADEAEVVSVPFPASVPSAQGGAPLPPRFFKIRVSEK